MNAFTGLRASNYDKYKWLCDEMFANWIIDKIVFYGDSVLDVGCGNGFMLPYYSKFFKYVSAIEPSAYFYKSLMENDTLQSITIKQAFVEEIPFKSKSFDIVIAKSSLHHFSDVKKGLGEMKRVAKNLVAVIEVVTPTLDTLEFISKILPKKEQERDIKTIYTKNSLLAELKNAFSGMYVYQLLFDQYIDVDTWLQYSDLNQFEKETLYKNIENANSLIKQELHIRQYKGRLVMLRRMCLSMIEL